MIIAPVIRFEATVDKHGGTIVGYAAPARGMAPCRVDVRNGGQIVAAAAAINFVGADCPVRLGWCGFTLRLDAGLFAFDNRAELVCGSSGRTLFQLDLDGSDLPETPVPGATLLPTTVLALAATEAYYTPVAGIVELVQAVIARTSAEQGVHALYGMLLARAADELGIHEYRPRITSKPGIETVVRLITNSDEYRQLPLEMRFNSPYRCVNAVEPLLAIAASDGEDPPAAGGRQKPAAKIRMQDLVAANRENQDWLILRHQRLADAAAEHARQGATGGQTATVNVDAIAKIAAALLGAPAWWGWLPGHWRQQKISLRLRNLGVFDGAAYLRRYPDVSETGMDPLRHYLAHGRHEGRSV